MRKHTEIVFSCYVSMLVKDCDLKSCLGMGHPNQSKSLFLDVSHFGGLFLNEKMTAWVN